MDGNSECFPPCLQAEVGTSFSEKEHVLLQSCLECAKGMVRNDITCCNLWSSSFGEEASLALLHLKENSFQQKLLKAP